MFNIIYRTLMTFSGCSGVFEALFVAIGRHSFQAKEHQPTERHSEAILWTVLLCYSVRAPSTHIVLKPIH